MLTSSPSNSAGVTDPDVYALPILEVSKIPPVGVVDPLILRFYEVSLYGSSGT